MKCKAAVCRTALPGGNRNNNGNFNNLTNNANFWSSTENSTTDAWYRYLYYIYQDVFRNDYDKALGFSCRCCQD